MISLRKRLFVTTLKLWHHVIPQQFRTTYILRMVNKPQPVSLNSLKPLVPYEPEHFLYELVDDLDAKDDPDIQLVLLSFVEGIGQAGDVVSVPCNFARAKLLLPKKAVYASPENIKEYAVEKDASEKTYSTYTVPLTIQMLASQVVGVQVSSTVPWTLEPWHVQTGFRLSGIAVAEGSVSLPEEDITGPDLDKQNKDFLAYVTINKKEEVAVRCRLHHIGVELFPDWKYIPSEPILSSQAETLSKLHLPKKQEKDKQNEVQQKSK